MQRAIMAHHETRQSYDMAILQCKELLLELECRVEWLQCNISLQVSF